MAWNTLTPVIKTTGKAMVAITISARKKDGQTRGMVTVAETFLSKALLDAEYVIIAEGEGEHEGQMMVTAATKDSPAAVKFGTLRNCRRIILPNFKHQPNFAVAMEDCKSTMVEGATSFVIELPLGVWSTRKVALDTAKARTATNATVAAKPILDDPAKSSSKNIDAVKYLVKKGDVVAKLAGGFYQFNGDRVEADFIVMRINSFRVKEALNPITKFDLAA